MESGAQSLTKLSRKILPLSTLGHRRSQIVFIGAEPKVGMIEGTNAIGRTSVELILLTEARMDDRLACCLDAAGGVLRTVVYLSQ